MGGWVVEGWVVEGWVGGWVRGAWVGGARGCACPRAKPRACSGALTSYDLGCISNPAYEKVFLKATPSTRKESRSPPPCTFFTPSMRRSTDSGSSVVTACTTISAKKSRSPETWVGCVGWAGPVVGWVRACEPPPHGQHAVTLPCTCTSRPPAPPAHPARPCSTHQLGVERRLRALLQQRLALLQAALPNVHGQLVHARNRQRGGLAKGGGNGARVHALLHKRLALFEELASQQHHGGGAVPHLGILGSGRGGRGGGPGAERGVCGWVGGVGRREGAAPAPVNAAQRSSRHATPHANWPLSTLPRSPTRLHPPPPAPPATAPALLNRCAPPRAWEREMSTSALAAGCTMSRVFMIVAPSLEMVAPPRSSCISLSIPRGPSVVRTTSATA